MTRALYVPIFKITAIGSNLNHTTQAGKRDQVFKITAIVQFWLCYHLADKNVPYLKVFNNTTTDSNLDHTIVYRAKVSLSRNYSKSQLLVPVLTIILSSWQKHFIINHSLKWSYPVRLHDYGDELHASLPIGNKSPTRSDFTRPNSLDRRREFEFFPSYSDCCERSFAF